MRKQIIALLIVAVVLLFDSASAQKPTTVLKANGVYQFATFEGYRTHCLGFGGTIERHIGYSKKSFFFTYNYLDRADGTPRYLPRYDGVHYFALGGKQYASYEQPLNGAYVGLLFGLGIPKDQGVFWDFDFLFGYQVIKSRLVLDLYTAIGFCSYSFREDYIAYSVYYYMPGFVFKPGLSIGIAF